MNVRAKFRVTEILNRAVNYGGTAGSQESNYVKLSAVGDDLNKTWSKWTPSGELSMTINNPEAFSQFKLGQTYFLDFSEAPQKEADEAK
jgi:hypothetical protein